MTYQIEYDKEKAVYYLYRYETIKEKEEVKVTLVHMGTYDQCLTLKEQLE